MSSAVLLFLARVGLLVLLYLFLYIVVRALRSDLRTATRPAPARPVPASAPAKGKAPARSAPVTTGAGLHLEVVDGGQTGLTPGQRLPLKSPLTIGRSASNNLTLDDDWISGRHLRLRQRNGTWIVEDVGSTNGSRVNGQPLTGATRVRPGDVLDLGRVKLKLVEHA